MICVEHDLQSTVGGIDIQNPYGVNMGVCQSDLSVNVVTTGLHTDYDVTYPTISVLLQQIQSTDKISLYVPIKA